VQASSHSRHAPHPAAAPPRSETELKQLNGWRATVDNLVERLQDLIAQKAALAPDAAAEAAAVADVAGAGAGAGALPDGAPDLEAGGGGDGEGRAAVQAASVQLSINKMR
jgi:hypothetical protein